MEILPEMMDNEELIIFWQSSASESTNFLKNFSALRDRAFSPQSSSHLGKKTSIIFMSNSSHMYL